jgi:hypothetical protein
MSSFDCTRERMSYKKPHLTHSLYSNYSPFWQQELTRSANAQETNPKDQPKLRKALENAYGSELGTLGIWKFANSFFIFVSSYYIVRGFISWSQDPQQGKEIGYLWAVALVFSSIGQVYSLSRMNAGCANMAVRAKAALTTMIYRKALRLNVAFGMSAAVDLIARDVARIQDGFLYCHYTWGSIPELAAVITFLSLEIGVYVLPAVGIICLILPLQIYIGILKSRYQEELGVRTDERVSLVAGILDAIKIVKYK